MKRDALAIYQAALKAVDPEQSTLLALQKIPSSFDGFKRIYLVAVGKAAIGMATGVEKFFGKRLTSGLAISKVGHGKGSLRNVQVLEAGHPVPDAAGLLAAERTEQLLRELNRKDLLIVAVSGGASALLPAPCSGITLADKQRTTELLLKAGADIFELNAVRKHLSRLKGGQMAALAYPARVVGLLLSDVIGNAMDVIGSGLTAPDQSTVADARSVLEKYALVQRAPSGVRKRLGLLSAETPKVGDPIFKSVRNVIIASNQQALVTAAEKARALGYRTQILSSSIQGEAREVGRVHASILRDLPPGRCVLTGGETTVTVTGKGMGGRNQEFAMGLAMDIAGMADRAALCAGTDGMDGPTNAAGGYVTGETVNDLAEARRYLAENDSYTYLHGRGALIKTGPTGTNVMDINILLSAQRR